MQDRMEVEAAALKALHPITPQHIPQVLVYDSEAACMVLEFLPPPHKKLLSGIAGGQQYPQLQAQLAALLARYFWYTSKYHLSPGKLVLVDSGVYVSVFGMHGHNGAC
jgi:5-methylthioribose kinase